jgi:hypothetical protein
MTTPLRALLVALAVASAIAGCGGSASPPAATVVTPPKATVTGIVTPKSVSVVTAN